MIFLRVTIRKERKTKPYALLISFVYKHTNNWYPKVIVIASREVT